jgi:hypothetical protein
LLLPASLSYPIEQLSLWAGQLAPQGNLATKWRRLSAGARPNPSIDPTGYRRAIDGAEQRFRAEVAHEL